MDGNRMKQLTIKLQAKVRVTLALNRDQRLERFQRLQRSFEADRPRFDLATRRRLPGAKATAGEILLRRGALHRADSGQQQ